MELRQLKYFVKAAETLNFSDAARVMNVAQSTLSQGVRQLEDELDVQLFERNSHAIRLTEAGTELLPLALRTINDASACVDRISDLRELLTGTLDIGVTYSFSPILTETILTFTKRYPAVKLNIFYKPMAELMDMLVRSEIDFVLAFRPSQCNPEIESHVLFDDSLAVIVRKSHPLAAKTCVSLSDLRNYQMALPSRGLQARNAFDAHLACYDTPLDIKIELNEVNILLKLVKQSDMVTVLAGATVYNESGVKAIALDIPGTGMDGCVHMLRNVYRKHSALEFIKLLRESDAVRLHNVGWFL